MGNPVAVSSIRLKLVLSYLGGAYQGWQIQEYKNKPQPPTLQAVVEKALAIIVGHPVRTHAASRTDAGVHARSQVIHVDVPESKAGTDWRSALNHNLPHDVSVRSVERVPDSFHARFDSKSKRYAYSLWLDRRWIDPGRREFTWATGPLDLEAMDCTAQGLLGRRDFACFRNQGCQNRTTVRTLFSVERRFVPAWPGLALQPAGPDGEAAPEPWPELVYLVWGDGFLKQMVRNIIALLVAVGRGRLSAARALEIAQSGDRSLVPGTAPARGLTLMEILY